MSRDPDAVTPDAVTPDAVTRSEEELRVETVWRPAERVRLRRRIVEEEVTVPVRVRREVLEIEREPLSPYSDPGRGEYLDPDEELVMELYEERPVVAVEVVPVERVHVRRGRVRSGRVDVEEDLRRERVEVERDAG